MRLSANQNTQVFLVNFLGLGGLVVRWLVVAINNTISLYIRASTPPTPPYMPNWVGYTSSRIQMSSLRLLVSVCAACANVHTIRRNKYMHRKYMMRSAVRLWKNPIGKIL